MLLTLYSVCRDVFFLIMMECTPPDLVILPQVSREFRRIFKEHKIAERHWHTHMSPDYPLDVYAHIYYARVYRKLQNMTSMDRLRDCIDCGYVVPAKIIVRTCPAPFMLLTPLNVATRRGLIEIVKSIITRLDELDYDYRSQEFPGVFVTACVSGSLPIVRYYLSLGADYTWNDYSGIKYLLTNPELSVDQISDILRLGIPQTILDSVLLDIGDVEKVKGLVQRGARIERYLDRLMIISVTSRNNKLLEYLMKNYQCQPHHEATLHQALWSRNVEAVRLLLEIDPSLEISPERVYEEIFSTSSAEMMKVLLPRQSDIVLTYSDLHYLLALSQEEKVMVLLSYFPHLWTDEIREHFGLSV